MQQEFWILLFHITGCVVSYLFFKALWKKDNSEWTRGDAWLGVIASTTGWINVIVCIAVFISERYKSYFNKPSKW